MTYLFGKRAKRQRKGSQPRKLDPGRMSGEQLGNLAGFFKNRIKHSQQRALNAELGDDEAAKTRALEFVKFYLRMYKKIADELERRASRK